MARVAVGLNGERLRGARAGGLTSRSLQVATRRETYRGPYDPDDLRLSDTLAGSWEPLRAALIVPIVHGGETLGTINLYHPDEDAFGPHDQQLLETIAERAALALYNGLLFDRTRSHANTDPLTGLYNLRYLTQHVDALCADGSRAAGPALPGPGQLQADQRQLRPPEGRPGAVRPGRDLLRDGARLGHRGPLRRRRVPGRPARGRARPRRRRCPSGCATPCYPTTPAWLHEVLGSLRLGVSIGWGCFPADGRDCTALLAAADARMYREKTQRKLGALAEPKRDASPRPACAPPAAGGRGVNSAPIVPRFSFFRHFLQ